MSTEPRFSIVIPVRNEQRFAEQSLRSVLADPADDREIVIVDDGSTDGTPGILERLAAADRRIVLLRSETNVGLPVALNIGLRAARGRYIARHDADDLCMPARFRLQADLLDADPRVALVSAGFDLIDEQGRWIGREWRDQPPEVTAYLLHFSNAIGGHGQVMFRREQILAIGGYSELHPLSEDYELWTRVSRLGKIVFLPMIGMKHRVHPGSVSFRQRDAQEAYSRAVTRGMLGRLLRRDLTDEEDDAVASVWRQDPQPGRPDVAHRVLEEAYGHFARAHRDADHRRHVRQATSLRWSRTARALLRRQHWSEAAVHARYATRWHPAAIMRSALHLAHQTAMRSWSGTLGTATPK